MTVRHRPVWSQDDMEWRFRAACRNVNPEWFFPKYAPSRKVKAICEGCPVREQCLAYAIEHDVEYGVWGGMIRKEREAM